MTRSTKLASPGVAALEDLARQARAHIVRTIAGAHGGHLGGPLSVIDVLIALYFQLLRIRPQEPDWPDRDRLVLSKGHSSIALYTALAMRGYFPIAELSTFDAIDSRLQGHPDMTRLPGLDMSSGSLRQGISPGIGMALGARMRGMPFHTYVVIGDGESQEGQIWEAAFVAARYALDTLTVVLDYNGLQQFGWQKPGEHMLTPIENPAGKWQAFGWNTIETDGHDIAQFIAAVERAKNHKGAPSIVIAHTIKGKGVSFIEDDYDWHARVPTDDELLTALEELGQIELTPLSLIGG